LPKIAMPTLAQFIAERDLSVDALAVLGEIDPSTAYRIVTGQSRPRPVTVVRLARALGIGTRRMQDVCRATWDEAHQGQDVTR
jgi:plasmid maintenance system antidote protein VapI